MTAAPDAVVTVLLAEYGALKTEQLGRINARDGLAYATLTGIVAVAGGALQFHLPLLLLALPAGLAILGWTRLSNDHKVTQIGGYLGTKMAPALIEASGVDRESVDTILGWESGYRTGGRSRSRKLFQLAIELLMFVVPAYVAVGVWASVTHARPAAAGVAAGVDVLLATAMAWQIITHADLGGTGTNR